MLSPQCRQNSRVFAGLGAAKTQSINTRQLYKIGLCTSTQWSLADSYWCSSKIMPIDCQSKAKMLHTAAHCGRCDIVATGKGLCWEGEPQQRLKNTAITSIMYVFEPLNHGNLYLQQPLPPIWYNYVCYAHNLYTLCSGRPVMSFLFPTLPKQPGLILQYHLSLPHHHIPI